MTDKNTGEVDDFTIDDEDIVGGGKPEPGDVDDLSFDDSLIAPTKPPEKGAVDDLSYDESLIVPSGKPSSGDVDDLGSDENADEDIVPQRQPVPARPRRDRLGDKLVRHPKGRRKRTDSVAGQQSVVRPQTTGEFFDNML